MFFPASRTRWSGTGGNSAKSLNFQSKMRPKRRVFRSISRSFDWQSVYLGTGVSKNDEFLYFKRENVYQKRWILYQKRWILYWKWFKMQPRSRLRLVLRIEMAIFPLNVKKEWRIAPEKCCFFCWKWPTYLAIPGTKTVQQVRSHAQKYFKRIAREKTGEYIPPPEKRWI